MVIETSFWYKLTIVGYQHFQITYRPTVLFVKTLQTTYNYLLFVVIDEKVKESYPEHETQLSSIRWHLSEGMLALFQFNKK